MSYSLEPEQALQLVGPDLDPNCLQRLPADDTSSLLVCFVALHPKSTAMVMAGRSVHLTTLFPQRA